MTPDNPRFQVRECRDEWSFRRFTVVDTKSGRRVMEKDRDDTAAELAKLLNACWAEVQREVKESRI